MKKFLFTLASLLVAGSAFANSYLYIEKFDATPGYVDVTVKAHFEEYVSAFMAWFTMPEGMSIVEALDGADMTISYKTATGRDRTYTPALSQNLAAGNFIVANQLDGYYQENGEGSWIKYGAIKWNPGDYEDMFTITVEVTDAYAGGDIIVRTECSSGADPRFNDEMRSTTAKGNTVPWIEDGMIAEKPTLAVDNAEDPTKVTATEGSLLYLQDNKTGGWNFVENPYDLVRTDVEQTLNFMACMPNEEGKVGSEFVFLTVTVPAATTPAQPAPEPTISYENGQVSAAVAGEDPAEHEVELYIVNGEERTKVENPYTPTQTLDEQEITFVAVTIANDDESENTECDPVTITVPAKEDNQAPKPTFRVEDGKLYAESAEGLQVVLTVNGETVPNPYTLPTENTSYTDAIVIDFVAVAIADGEVYNVNSEEATYHFELAPLQKTDVESPSVQGMSNDDAWLYNVIILGEGDGELKYTVVDGEGNTVVPAQTIVDDETGLVTLVFEKGNEAANIIVTAWTEEGPTCNASDQEVKPITIPALDKVATPEINYTVNDDNTITITATCATEGATIVLKDPEGNVVENPATVSYDPYVGYNKTWTATATKEHMQPSDEGTRTIILAAGDKTPVEAPSIMGMKAEGSKTLYNIVITPDPATDGELDYSATPMGELLRAGAVTIQYERGAEPYNVEVTAKTLEGATCQESPVEQKTITVPALDKVATPTVNWAPNSEGSLDVWATTTTDDATVTLTDGTNTYTVAAGEHVTITYDPEAGYNKTWTATASATDMLDSDESDPVEIDIPAVIPPVETGKPTISVVPDYENAVVVVTITGADENDALTGKVTFAEGEPMTAEGTGVITMEIPMGEDVDFVNIYATATAKAEEGVEVIPNDNQELFVEIPARTAAPTINQEEGVSTYAYMIDPETHEIIMAPDGKPACLLDEDGNRIILEDGHYVTVTLENNDDAENVVMEYSLDGETWLTYDELLSEIIFGMTPEGEHVDGTFDIYARATAVDENGNPIKGTSEVVHEQIKITPATGVNELANGKTVAGVRYFNMAGQEMQEANGVTIVVTTYTDGTTSAVKVLK